MKKLRVIAFSVFGVFVALPVTILVVWWCWAHFFQSPQFARTYFEDFLEFDEVVESRRWHWGKHPWGGNAFGCTYAIVNIPKTTSPHILNRWSGQWTETPVIVPEGRHDIFDACRYLWSDGLNARLSRAHNNSGSYYSATQETVLLFSPREGVAARIRFGD